jgi:hypothetical protein
MTAARRWPTTLIVAGAGSLVIATAAVLGWPLVVTATVALGVLVLAVESACRTKAEQPAADLEITLSSFGGAALVAMCVPQHWGATLLGALAVAATIVAGRTPLRAPALWLPVMCAAIVVTIATPFDTWVGVGILALSASAAITWWRTQELWLAHLAAGLAVVATPFGLTAIGATSAEVAAAMLVVAVVLTGSSFVVLTSGPVASAAMTASALAAFVAPVGSPVLVSVAVAVLGIQIALEGLIRSRPEVARAGAAIAAAGTLSSWWTSGANDAVLDWLEPHGVTSGDLAIVALSALLVAGGAYAGRVRAGLSSWVTIGPGLGTLAVWLVDAQLTREVGWSVPLALGLGVVAVGVGGWRRLAAPLVLGTVTIGMTIVVSAGPRLAELDSWVWLALGGLGLLAVAVLVERAQDRAQ